MQKHFRRLASVVGGLAVAAGTLTAAGTANATSGTASAERAPAASAASDIAPASCYGGAVNRTFAMGQSESPRYFGPWTNSSRCNDINLKITSWGNANPLKARVCFYPGGGNTRDCQTRWKDLTKKADLNKWRVLATNVKAGTKYEIQLDFASNTFKGQVAH